MIEYLESRTLNAVDPSSVTFRGYAELAITKAGRLIVHGTPGSQLLRAAFGSSEVVTQELLQNPMVDLGIQENRHFSLLLYVANLGRFEQLAYAEGSDPQLVAVACQAFGEMTDHSDYVSLHDGLGMNLMIRSRYVRSLEFDMGGGDDVVLIPGDFGRPSQILGGAGDDTLISARGGDTIAGGRGDDRIVSRADNQVLIGGRGDDVFITRSTSQTIFAGAGRDSATQVGYANEDGLEDFVAIESLR